MIKITKRHLTIWLLLRECSFITGGGDGSKSGGSTKIIEGREGGVRKNLDLMRGLYENNINGVRGGSTKIKLMEPEIHVYLKRILQHSYNFFFASLRSAIHSLFTVF